jgi:hypothetical protein
MTKQVLAKYSANIQDCAHLRFLRCLPALVVALSEAFCPSVRRLITARDSMTGRARRAVGNAALESIIKRQRICVGERPELHQDHAADASRPTDPEVTGHPAGGNFDFARPWVRPLRLDARHAIACQARAMLKDRCRMHGGASSR